MFIYQLFMPIPFTLHLKTERGLQQHFIQCHQQRRQATNSSICHTHIHATHKSTLPNYWSTGLQFIHHNIEARPAEARAGIREIIKPSLYKAFLRLFNSFVKACNLSSAIHVPTNEEVHLPEWETEDHVFWWILFHAELLIFCPNRDESETANQCVNRRLQLLITGQIEELWNEATKATSRPPGTVHKVQTSTVSVNKAAQAAADVDNYRTAFACATSDLPIAKITSSVLNKSVKKLYPPKLPTTNPSTPLRPQSPTTCPNAYTPYFQLRGDIIETIKHAARGKATGFVMDSMDIFISIAKSDDAAANHELSALFTRLFNGQIHETIVPFVTSTYLFCLA